MQMGSASRESLSPSPHRQATILSRALVGTRTGFSFVPYSMGWSLGSCSNGSPRSSSYIASNSSCIGPTTFSRSIVLGSLYPQSVTFKPPPPPSPYLIQLVEKQDFGKHGRAIDGMLVFVHVDRVIFVEWRITVAVADFNKRRAILQDARNCLLF